MQRSAGIEMRLSRLFDPVSKNTIVVALDHGLFMGPLPGLNSPVDVAAMLLDAGTDAIQSPPGQAPGVAARIAARGKGSVLYRLDSTNMWRSGSFAPVPGFWTPVGSPLDAIRCGADVAVCFLIAGWGDDAMEAANVRQIGQWASECADLGLPFMVEPLPLGPNVANENEPALVATLCRMAYELGATVIKSNYTGDPETFRQITSDVPVPVLMRGGPRASSDEAYLAMVEDAMLAGARGVVVGRNVFQAADPAAAIASLRAIVHRGSTPV
jgi:class I fructose-bisphosphate aldolase